MPNYDMEDEPFDTIGSDDSDEEQPGEDHSEEPNASTPGDPTESKSKGKKKKSRNDPPKFAPVSAEDRKAILQFFDKEILGKKCIGKKQCVSFLKSSKSGLQWEQVKIVVNNKIQYLQRVERKRATTGQKGPNRPKRAKKQA